MSPSTRLPTLLRPILRHPSRHPRAFTQRRTAIVQPHHITLTHRSQSTTPSATERYKEKLVEKARKEGHESIGDLKEAYRDKIKEVRRKSLEMGDGTPTPNPRVEGMHSPPEAPTPQPHAPQPPSPQQQRPQASPDSTTGIKPLSSYIDIPKISSLPAKEIELIWRLRHASSPLSLCATIPLPTYQRIYETAKRHPQFILPLPRPAADDGSGDIKQSDSGFTGGERTAADVHFLQWGFHPPSTPGALGANTHTSTVIFTHLAAFKLHGTYAQPHTTITHHLDLADSHGIVLLNGAVVDGRGVSAEEGRWLLMCLQKFYDFEGHGGGIGREKRQGLLEKFSKGDQGFSLEELVDEAERIS
jgi:ATP synthase mitochondrial F1 complex assembly factor 1